MLLLWICRVCSQRLSTTPKPYSFVGMTKCVMNDDPEDEGAEARAQQDADVLDSIKRSRARVLCDDERWLSR